jgi:hypothetical protein
MVWGGEWYYWTILDDSINVSLLAIMGRTYVFISGSYSYTDGPTPSSNFLLQSDLGDRFLK